MQLKPGPDAIIGPCELASTGRKEHTMLVETIALFLLILVNGALAMSELALVSSRRSRLEHQATQGSRGSQAALRLIDDPGRFLATVQIGITLVGIVAGAFGGATLGRRIGDWLNEIPWISPHGQLVGMTVTVAAITYLSLILGELVPKRVALAQPERTASLVARPIEVLSKIAIPAVWVLHASTESVLKALRLSGVRETTITEDEVKSLIAEGTQAGVFVPQEQEMIEGVLRLADRSVRVIMTPRANVVWVDVSSDRDAILGMVEAHRFSRLLVCDGTLDRPIGFVHTKDLLPGALRKGDVTALRSLTGPLLCVTDRTPVLRLLSRFKKEGIHNAVVVDEYGMTEGVVTLTDVIEAIAGDLPERGEANEAQMVRRDDGSWLADGMTPTDEVESATGIDMGDEVETLAGFVLEHLERIPETGAHFECGGARFEVVDMDGNRIDKVLIHVSRSHAQTDG